MMRGPCDRVNAAFQPSSAPAKCNAKWVLTATILGSSLAFIDGTIVNLALPALQDAFHATVSQLQWVIEAYSLVLAALLIVGGAMGDIYGRRFIFLLGVIIFAIASILCGASTTISQLIAARTIQGIGAALLVPGSLAIITASFSEETRGRAIGIWAGFTSITTAAGPVVGGWLLQHTSWRWIFLLNIPLAAIVLIVTYIYVPESAQRPARMRGTQYNEQRPPKLDLIGALLITLGLGAIVFGLIEWEANHQYMMIIELIGIGALVGFLFVETQTAYPMMPLNMFRSYKFSGANLITFFLYFPLYGVLFFLPLNLIQVQGYTPTEAGFALLPLILLLFLLSGWAGGLVKQYGPRLPLVIGPILAAIGYALFLRTGIGYSYWTSFFPPIVMLGLGMAVSVAPLTTVVMSSVTANHVGAASGINNAISRIAGLLAIAILGLVMTFVFNQHFIQGLQKARLPHALQQQLLSQRDKLADIKTNNVTAKHLVQTSFISGYQVIVSIGVVMALASSLCAALLIGRNDYTE